MGEMKTFSGCRCPMMKANMISLQSCKGSVRVCLGNRERGTVKKCGWRDVQQLEHGGSLRLCYRFRKHGKLLKWLEGEGKKDI